MVDPSATLGFDLWIMIYTGIGVTVFWGKWAGRSRLRPYVLSDLLEALRIPLHIRIVMEFLIFLVLGCIVAIGVVAPQTPIQAITAGFGWTGVFAQSGSRRS
jgi:hypothetical protein